MLSLVEITAFRLESKSCKGFFWKNNFSTCQWEHSNLEQVTWSITWPILKSYRRQLPITHFSLNLFFLNWKFHSQNDINIFSWSAWFAQLGLRRKKKFTWDRAAIQWWYLTSHYISGFCVLLSTTVGWNFIWRSIDISEKYSYFNYILMIEYRKVANSRLVYYSILKTFGQDTPPENSLTHCIVSCVL